MRKADGFALFDTPIGTCGIGRSPNGLAAVQLAAHSASALRNRLRRRFRVVAAGGKIGGFSATGGVATKLRLLSIEGARNTLFARP